MSNKIKKLEYQKTFKRFSFFPVILGIFLLGFLSLVPNNFVFAQSAEVSYGADLSDAGENYQPGEGNQVIFKFNAYNSGGGTLDLVKLYVGEIMGAGHPSELIGKIRIYQDSADIGEFGDEDTPKKEVDVSSSDWQGNGPWFVAIDLTGGSEISVPTSNQGNLGFIVIDIKPDAPMGASFVPYLDVGSFDFSVDALDTAMDNQLPFNKPGVTVAGKILIGTDKGTPVLISEVQLAGSNNPQEEFIEIYNRTPEPENFSLSGWDLVYSQDGNSWTQIVEDLPSDASFGPGGFFLFLNPSLGGKLGGISGDVSGTTTWTDLSATSGIIALRDPQDKIVDKLGWGSVTSSECEGGNCAQTPSPGQSLERKAYGDSTAQMMASGGVDEKAGNSFDSNDNGFDFVVQLSPSPQNSSSAPETPQPPGDEMGGPAIMHLPIFKATAGQPLTVYARMGDPMTPMSQLITELYYKTGDSDPADNQLSEYSKVSGSYLGNGYWKFTTAQNVGSGENGMHYLLHLKGDGGERYMSASPDADITCFEGTCATTTIAQNPFIVNGFSAGTYAVSATVLDGDDNNAPVEGAYVILEGSEYGTTTDANGNFSISNVRGDVYNVVVIKDGYFEEEIFDVYVSGDANLGNIILYQGQGGGMSGDTSKPHVIWTGPADGMMGVPAGDANFLIFLGFDKDLDSSTFNGTNVYLTTDGTTHISGVTIEYSNDPSTRPPEYPPDSYLGVVHVPSPNGLEPNTTYYVVLTDNVRDTAGNSLEGNRPDGSYIFSFTTGQTFTGEEDFGQGAFQPPFVLGTQPFDGAMNVALNTKILIKFAEPLNPDSVNAQNIKLYKVVHTETGKQETQVSLSDSNFSLDVTGAILTITPSSALSSDSDYEIRVSGAVQSVNGVWLGDPGKNENTSSFIVFRSHFTTGSTLDTTGPTIVGTKPQDGAVDVPINKGKVIIQFSEAMNPSTVNANTVKLKRGSNVVSSIVEYDPIEKSAKIIPLSLLATGAQYTIYVKGGTGGVEDLAGNTLDAHPADDTKTDFSNSFTTSNQTDDLAPTIISANGDEWSLAITFSEPMNSAKPGESKFSASVLNPANYTLKWGEPDTVASNGESINLSGKNFSYEPVENTVFIEGIGLNVSQISGKDYWVQVSNVTDLSGNVIDSSGNTFQMPINNSAQTQGFLGPMGPGPGGMIGPDMGEMGMMKAGVFPMNMMAGQVSKYFVDIPISNGLENGGRIVLTFPDGFDISNAVPDAESPMNDDMNGPGSGIVTFKTSGVSEDANASTQGGAPNDGVTINPDANTITIWLTTTETISGTDFLHIDLDGIVNSNIPKGFDTPGYTVGIKILKADGTLSEDIGTTMPFFITQSGNLTLGGTITLSEAPDAQSTMELCLGSPMTGPMCQNITFGASDTQKSYSFTGLNPGDYFLFTEPIITLNGKDYQGISVPEPIYLTESITNKNLTFNKITSTGRATITVQISGTFNNEGIDVFAGGPSTFFVKTKTLNGEVTNDQTTLYLDNGDWMVGMGPAMPKGPMAGPPPMPDWIPPIPVRIVVSGCPSSCSVTEYGPSTITGDNTTDGIVSFNIEEASLEVHGKVTKEDGKTGIPNAEVYAYQPGSKTGIGGHATTDSSGNFVLKLADTGTYKIGAFKPGLPSTFERTIGVETNSGTEDGNSTCDVYLDSTLVTESNPLILKLQRPDYTISGKVTDGTDPVAFAPVWADRIDGPGHADAMTDSSGNYIIYVTPGTWQLRAYVPGFGDIGPEIVVITNSSETKNLAPATNIQMYQISGNVNIGGEARANEPIRAVKFDAQGNYLGQEFSSQTDSQGNYTISVPPGYYRVDIWTPEYGEIEALPQGGDQFQNSPASLQVTNSNVSNVNISIQSDNLKTVTISFTNGSSYQGRSAFIDIEKIDPQTKKPLGVHRTLDIPDVSVINTIQLPDGDYHFFAHVEGLGEFIPQEANDQTSPGYVDISEESTVHFVLPDASTELITISGQVTDGTNPIADAWVWIDNPQTSYHNGTPTNNNGNYTLQVPKLSSGNYKMGADKPGYLSSEPIDIKGSTSTTQNLTLTQADVFIEGVLYDDANGNGTYNSGEELTVGFVWAEETSTGKRTHTPVNPDGTYQLPVTNGSWYVYGVSDGYQETPYRVNGNKQSVSVSGSTVSNINIDLDEISNWQEKSKAKPIVPASGGILDDTGSSGTGVKLTIPPSALGDSTAQGQLRVRETNGVVETAAATPFGGKGKEIKAYDNSGQVITNLNQQVDLEIVYYKSEVKATGIVDYSKLKALTLGYWDETKGEWVSLPTVRTAYTKKTGSETEFSREPDFDTFVDNLISDADYYADYKIVLSANTDHFTIFGAINPTDSTPPSAPTGLTAASGDGKVILDWNDNSESDLMEYEVYRSTSPGVQVLDSNQVNQSQVSVSNFTDNTVQNWTSYYYVITAVDDSGNESSPSAEVQVCPHPSIEHGTVSVDCTITCEEGYTLSDHTCAASGGTVNLGGGGDTIAPSISNITVSVSSTSAKISWTTNESSISWIVYGTSTDYGSEIKTTDYLTSHSLTITGLCPETTYHYQIKSEDSSG
ncbi:carboxypeptidase regulatory-like domain-containing protein, partial [bacterium]|nr:carboxypeptidase regulatory-like domain-containing protein [bacterium]